MVTVICGCPGERLSGGGGTGLARCGSCIASLSRATVSLLRVICTDFTLPCLICIYIWGSKGDVVEKLLVYTQVFLSLALPISMVPLLLITSSKKMMGEFVNGKTTMILGWISTVALVVLNIQLIWATLAPLF